MAEDVAINSEIVMTLLEQTHIEIECAENGEEAVRMYRESPDRYDLILMDVQMPKLDGYEASRLIREMDGDVPIIAMTANVFKEDVETCLASGMNDHIGKPLDVDEMLDKLGRWLNM